MYTARANDSQRPKLLLSSIVNPARSGGIRLPTPGVPTLTSTMNLQSTLDVSTLPAKQITRFLLTNDPVMPLWCETSERWAMFFDLGMVATRAPSVDTEGDITFESATPAILPFQSGPVTFNSTGSLSVWPLSFVGVHSSREYFYVPAGATVTFFVIFSSGTGSPKGYLNLAAYDNGTDSVVSLRVDNLTLSAGLAEFTPPINSRWFRPVQFSTDSPTLATSVNMVVLISSAPVAITANPINIVVGPTAVVPSPCLMPATRPDIYNSSPVLTAVRTVSVRLDVSNYTKAVNVEGMIHLAQASATSDRWNWSQTDITTRHPRLRYSAKAAIDLSMVLLPAGSSPSFRDALRRTPCFDLDSDSPFIIGSLFDGNPADQSSFAFVTSWQIEFMNTTQLWPVGFTPYTVRDVEDVARTIAITGFAGPTSSFFRSSVSRSVRPSSRPRRKKPVSFSKPKQKLSPPKRLLLKSS